MREYDLKADSIWKADGKCYDLSISPKKEDKVLYKDFFEDWVEKRQRAAEFCEGCPVQQKCLKWALETGQLWGVWGGRDETELRRDLFTTSIGTVGHRSKNPKCTWCRRKKTLSITDEETSEVTCSFCGFSWKSEATCVGLRYFGL